MKSDQIWACQFNVKYYVFTLGGIGIVWDVLNIQIRALHLDQRNFGSIKWAGK